MVQREESYLISDGWLLQPETGVYNISLICARGRGPDELAHFAAQEGSGQGPFCSVWPVTASRTSPHSTCISKKEH